jgi:predicted ester cyclase
MSAAGGIAPRSRQKGRRDMKVRKLTAIATLAVAGLLLVPGLGTGSSLGTASIARAQDATPAAACADLDEGQMAAMARAWTDHSFTAAPDPAFDDMLADDLRYHSAAFGVIDAAGWLEARVKLEAAFSGATIEVNETIVDAPFVVTHWTATGTFSGEFMGMPPTGEPVDWDGIGIYRFDCGKIAEAWTEIDQYGRLDPVTPEAAAPAAAPAAACADSDAPVAEADAEALIRTWWDTAWNGGDISVVDDITAPDVLHHWAMGPDTVGDATIAERIGGWKTAMPDMAITAGDILVDGTLAAARWTASGTDTGGYMGNPPTGNRAEWSGINIFRIQCGEITEIWSEMDVMGMTEQLQD